MPPYFAVLLTWSFFIAVMAGISYLAGLLCKFGAVVANSLGQGLVARRRGAFLSAVVATRVAA